MEGVYFEIGLFIEDTLTLIHYCVVNHDLLKLRDNNHFWVRYYNKYKLPLSETINCNWSQLLQKTKFIVSELNDICNVEKLNRRFYIERDICIYKLLNLIEKDDVCLKDHLDDFYDNDNFMIALDNKYPIVVNYISAGNSKKGYFLCLVVNQDIEKIPGGTDILIDYGGEIAFEFVLSQYQIEMLLIGLIQYI